MADSRARVLVVDDDAAFGGMVAEVLVERGFDVTRFVDPREALERARAEFFAVALVDLLMPGMTGIELVEHLRAESPDTQVIILTGQANLDSALKGIRHGVYGYLQKEEIRVDLIAGTVAGALEKARLRDRERELMERLHDSNRLLRSLQASSNSMAAEAHLDLLLTRVVGAAKEACRAAIVRAILFETGPDGDLVISQAVGDGGDILRGARLGAEEGIAVLAAQSGVTLAMEDARAHPRYSHRCDSVDVAGGYACAPLRHGKVLGTLVAAGSARGGFSPDEQEVLSALALQAAVAIDNAQSHERSLNFFAHTSDILVSFLETLDVNCPGQSRGVAELSDMITRHMGLTDEERRNIHYGALLHDIGKVRLDRALLEEPGRLPPEGRLLLQEHCRLGMEMLKPISLWEDTVSAHHERWDGKGYPRALAGESIPLGARIVAVADAFYAMGRQTAYTKRRTVDERLHELEACGGTQFDPNVVRSFVAAYRERGDPRASS